jgi:hypothetical protein
VIAALAAGVRLAGPLIALANRARSRWRRPDAIGLLVAALLYLVFAVTGKAQAPRFALETSGVLLFGGAALERMRQHAGSMAVRTSGTSPPRGTLPRGLPATPSPALVGATP